jgi:hypothetical protein
LQNLHGLRAPVITPMQEAAILYGPSVGHTEVSCCERQRCRGRGLSEQGMFWFIARVDNTEASNMRESWEAENVHLP